MIRPHDSYFM